MKTTQKVLSVFLVDDDELFLQSLKRELKRRFRNVRLSLFLSGEDCIKHMEEGPDVVILDYYLTTADLPNAMNGMEVLRKIKAFSDRIQVIMLSAQDKIDLAIKAIKNGAYEYIPKNEGAIIRVENTLKDIQYSMDYSGESKRYEKWNVVVAVFILLFVAATAYYYLHH